MGRRLHLRAPAGRALRAIVLAVGGLLFLDLAAPTLDLATASKPAPHNCGCAPGRACCCLLMRRSGPDRCRKGEPSAACSVASEPSPSPAPKAPAQAPVREAVLPRPLEMSGDAAVRTRPPQRSHPRPDGPKREPPFPPPKLQSS